MSGLSGARCVGQHDLFESTDVRDHTLARDLCAGCPALGPCAQLLREVQATTQAIKNSGGGPVGTWAGKLMGASPKELRVGRANPREHGTDRGYYQHRHQREAACEACRTAHAAAARKEALL